MPGHAEDGSKLFGEDNGFLAVAEQEDAVDRGFVGSDLVHRVLADEERAVGRSGDLAGVLHGGHAGDQSDRKAVGHLGQVGPRGSDPGKPAGDKQRRGPNPSEREGRHARFPHLAGRKEGVSEWGQAPRRLGAGPRFETASLGLTSHAGIVKRRCEPSNTPSFRWTMGARAVRRTVVSKIQALDTRSSHGGYSRGVRDSPSGVQ